MLLKPLTLLFLLAMTISCQAENQEIMIQNTAISTDAIRYLALGDSYTIGEGVGEHQRWPIQLSEKLNEAGIALGQPLIIARTGWTTSDLGRALDEQELQSPYALVTLLIGVNNQYRGPSRGFTPDNYRESFSILLQRAISLAGNRPDRVVVVSIPDYSVTPFVPEQDKARVASELEVYNGIKKEVSLEAGVHYTNITPISRMALDNQSLLANDGLHPSGQMYTLWVNQMLPMVKSALTK